MYATRHTYAAGEGSHRECRSAGATPLDREQPCFLLSNTKIGLRLARPFGTRVSQFALHLGSQRVERVVPAYECVASGLVGSVPVVTVDGPENHRQILLSLGELAERGGVERAPIPIVEILDPLRPASAHAQVVANPPEVPSLRQAPRQEATTSPIRTTVSAAGPGQSRRERGRRSLPESPVSTNFESWDSAPNGFAHAASRALVNAWSTC